jgi:deoxyribose-phosphate aldolase
VQNGVVNFQPELPLLPNTTYEVLVAAGGVRDLDGLIKVRDLGATRCGATATAAMLDEYRRRALAEAAGQETTGQTGTLGAGGY